MSDRNFYRYRDDFLGHRIYSGTPGSNVGHNWAATISAAAGTPTIVPGAGAEAGEVVVDLANNNEVENVSLHFADKLCFDIDGLSDVYFRLKLNQAAVDASVSLAIGVASARNDAIDSIAAFALIRAIGSTALVCETDDGVNDVNLISTGKVLGTSYSTLRISFTTGKKDVRFYIDGERVAAGQTFDMSNYSGSLQAYMQLQKTASVAVDGFTVDDVDILGRKVSSVP